MKRIPYILLLFVLSCLPLCAGAQVTIEACYLKARRNYPLIRRYDLIEKTKNYSLSNAGKTYLPQLQLSGKATYQSDVTSVPLDISGLVIPRPAKEQYQVAVEISQTLWDGGLVGARKKMTEANAELEKQQTEVEMFALENRINQLYFGILLLEAQLQQNKLLEEELERNYRQVASYLEFGIASRADLDVIRVEQLNAVQVGKRLASSRNSYLAILSVLIGEEVTGLVRPQQVIPRVRENNRPEQKLMEYRKQYIGLQEKLIKASLMPGINLFLQGGYGRPGLNMLAGKSDFFYVGGLRLSWNFSSLYTRGNDRRKIDVNKQEIDLQRETFLFDRQLLVIQEDEEINCLQELLAGDDEIIRLYENIRKAAEARLADGALTVTDLMREITRENLARQTKISHEIELLHAIYKLKNTINQ